MFKIAMIIHKKKILYITFVIFSMTYLYTLAMIALKVASSPTPIFSASSIFCASSSASTSCMLNTTTTTGDIQEEPHDISTTLSFTYPSVV